MAKLAKWMPSLLDSIDLGCSTSFSLSQLKLENEELMTVGRAICLDLWPFIRALPENVASVRKAVPECMEAARKLLAQLADDERYYQKLYVRQCLLAGLSEQDLSSTELGVASKDLCNVMTIYCNNQNYRDGVYVIVTAELAAAACSRTILPVFEAYFEQHSTLYEAADVSAGLEWLKLHSKPQTRHALWLKRMLSDIAESDDENMPEAVETMLQAVFALWRCPENACKVTGNRDSYLVRNS